MKNNEWIRELFGGGALTAEQFDSALEASGRELCDISDGGYVPASRERELLGEMDVLKERHAAELAAVRAESALVGELVRRGAHNPGMTAKAIGIGGMEGDPASLEAEAAARVAALMRSDPYLFGGPGEVVSTGVSHGDISPDPDAMSDDDYYRHMKLM